MIHFESHPLTSSQKLIRTLAISGLLMIFLFSLFWNPERVNLLPCFFHDLTRHSCPSCGLSRSFYALAHLNFHQSLEFHPMGMIIYFALLLFLLKTILEVILQKEIGMNLKDGVKKFAIGGLFFVWMGFWIVRIFSEH